MSRLTLALRLLLLSALILVPAHWAVDRAMARGALDVQLCADGSLLTVTLGRDGQPVSHASACPDCVLAGLAGPPPPAAPAAAPASAARRLPPPAEALSWPSGGPRPAARGPPGGDRGLS